MGQCSSPTDGFLTWSLLFTFVLCFARSHLKLGSTSTCFHNAFINHFLFVC